MQLLRSHHTVLRPFFHPGVQDDIWVGSTLHVARRNGGIYQHSRLLHLTSWHFHMDVQHGEASACFTKVSMDKLIIQEVSYNISIGLSTRLHRKKKAPYPTLSLQIGLYEIWNHKHVDAKMEEFKRFNFGTRSFNPYDPHWFVKDHYARVQFPWIHGACHGAEKDPWIYCQSFSRLNELVDITVE